VSSSKQERVSSTREAKSEEQQRGKSDLQQYCGCRPAPGLTDVGVLCNAGPSKSSAGEPLPEQCRWQRPLGQWRCLAAASPDLAVMTSSHHWRETCCCPLPDLVSCCCRRMQASCKLLGSAGPAAFRLHGTTSVPARAGHLTEGSSTFTPDSSSTSRHRACSRVSPISRKPARVEYLPASRGENHQGNTSPYIDTAARQST